MSRIAIFRALQLGDLLCSVPAIHALRQAHPKAHVTLIGLPWASAFVARYSTLFDEFMAFPGARGFPEQAETDARLPEFLGRARARRFELAIQLHGSGGVANDIVESLGARSCAGFVQPDERPRRGTFVAWPDHLPEVQRYNVLMRALGIPARETALWMPSTPRDDRDADSLVETHGIQVHRAVVVHAGAQWPSRRWPAQRFARVADALADLGMQVVLTGTAPEAALVAEIGRAMHEPAIELAGQTTLGSLAALIARVPLVVCNDTGISHVAAAMGTRSVVIASGSDTRRWAPLDRERHIVLARYPACRPCAYPECPYGHECALAVDEGSVISAAATHLSAARRAASHA